MTKSKHGFSVRIFLPSGEPEGLRIIEKSNWTGQGIVFPRALFADAKRRPEVKRTGVYILWGLAEAGELPQVYVGEGDPVLPRLEQHARNKGFWTHGIVFTSKDQNLNKAHVQYIESRLVALAAAAKRCDLDNLTSPNLPSLSEPDQADAEGFLADVLLCLPVVGVSMFKSAREGRPKGRGLFLKSKGIEAAGIDAPEGFIVRKGAGMVKREAPSIHTYLAELRKTLIQKQVFVDDGNYCRSSQDYTFSSPSTAAGVLLGRSANGRTEWKDSQGRTLKEIQEAEAGEVSDETH